MSEEIKSLKDLKYFNITVDEDHPEFVEQLRKEWIRVKKEWVQANNNNLAQKIILNSVYGVLGYANYIAYNRDVARSITAQSRHLIKYTIKIFNSYFTTNWNDALLQQKMGITTPFIYKEQVVNYADTDSVFVVLDGVYKRSLVNGYKGTIIDFVLLLRALDLDKYVERRMEGYIKNFGAFPTSPSGQKTLSLEMEQILYRMVQSTKKKYIKMPAYDGGTHYEENEKIEIKGLEANQSAFPKWCRDRQIACHKLFMKHKYAHPEFVNKLIEIKDEFYSDNVQIENICRVERISNYEKWIKSDREEIVIEPNAKPHVKGASFYNHLLYNSDYTDRYEPIYSTNKVCWYYTDESKINSFSFLSGFYPLELDPPPMNKNKQFEMMILNPINRILKACGQPEFDYTLILDGALW